MLPKKKVLPYTLLAGQILAMLSLIPMFQYAETWHWIVTGIFYFCIMTLGITLGYHRLISHKAFSCPLWLEYVMLFFANIMMVGPAIVWVANHREHHKFVDTHLDPHSPYYKGIFRAYFLQVMTTINFAYVKDLLKVERYRLQVKHYWSINIAWLVVLTLIDPFAVIYAWLAPAGLAKLIGSLVFTYSHRNRKPNTDLWVGLITFGEGFHEVHHRKPRLHIWHPLDIGGQLIRLIDRNVGT